MNWKVMVATVALLAMAVGCDEVEEVAPVETEPAEEPAEAPEPEPEPEPEAELQELDELGIQAMVPEGAQMAETPGGVTIIGMDVSMNVTRPSEFGISTELEEAQAWVEENRDPQGLEVEELEDGWLITYTVEGELGTSYALDGARTIGEETFMCQTSVGYESLRDGAVELCRTLQ